jgi:hypothetical protein
MSEENDDGTTETPGTEVTDWQAEADKWKALARKHEGQAKANATAAKELAQFRQSQMTETEKAVAEAEARGRTAALTATGSRLAKAELRAAAAGTVDKATLDGFLEYADLSKFVGDDGEPNTKAIEAAVKKLGGEPATTNFDGGARTTAGKPTDMNSLIRRSAGLS